MCAVLVFFFLALRLIGGVCFAGAVNAAAEAVDGAAAGAEV